MSAPSDPLLGGLLVALFALLLFLRIKFPNASKRSELAVLAATLVAFFVIVSAIAGYGEPALRFAAEATQLRPGR